MKNIGSKLLILLAMIISFVFGMKSGEKVVEVKVPVSVYPDSVVVVCVRCGWENTRTMFVSK